MSGSVKSYIAGFALSIALTIASFGLARQHVDSGHDSISHTSLFVAIFVLAVTQLAVQLIFFLHLGREQKPYKQSLSFLFVVFIISFLVIGSLWIMANLDYSHGGKGDMNPSETDSHIIEDEGITR